MLYMQKQDKEENALSMFMGAVIKLDDHFSMKQFLSEKYQCLVLFLFSWKLLNDLSCPWSTFYVILAHLLALHPTVSWENQDLSYD